MNIKNEETHRLAQELAALTGESLTAAVTVAVRERLDRVKVQERKERIRKIREECAVLLKGEHLPDPGEVLYDERGLPK